METGTSVDIIAKTDKAITLVKSSQGDLGMIWSSSCHGNNKSCQKTSQGYKV